LLSSNGCLPTLEINVSRECIAAQQRNLAAILASKISVVVVAFSWANLASDMTDAEGRPLGAVPWPIMQDQLSRVMVRLQRAGKQVLLVGPIPDPGYDVPGTVSREIAFRGRVQSPLGQSRAAFVRQFGPQQAWVESDPTGAIGILPARLFCDETSCSFELDGAPAYADSNHLSSTAVMALTADFSQGLGIALAREGNPSPSAEQGATRP
jgi:hypothetical protein